MVLNYSRIDPGIENRIREEIMAEVERLVRLMDTETNAEQAIKIFINSIYGALANQYFIGYNLDVAAAVTVQGQEIIKHARSAINRYFRELWHLDKEIHAVLGLGEAASILPVTRDVVIYVDTDSNYVEFSEVMESCAWDKDPIDFILKVYENRLRPYFTEVFDAYAVKYDTENIQTFELEDVTRTGIWLKPKKYVRDIAWKDAPRNDYGELVGIHFPEGKKVSAKGVEIVRSSTPLFARTRLKEFVRFIMEQKDNFRISDLVQMLNKAKKEFQIDNEDNICFTSTANNYEKWVINDQSKIQLKSACPAHIRAAASYNHLLRNSGLMNKYHLIRNGDKIKWYYTEAMHDNENAFAFLPGEYPAELDPPPIDLDVQFRKIMIEPINRFVVAVGHPPIPSNLRVSKALW
jgi:DNA polymerase elongation subunit (family B)